MRRRHRLISAWKKVYESGSKSKSKKTRDLIKEFSKASDKHIEKIYRLLLKRKFKFNPSDGVLLKKSSGSYRPIVKASIPNRIVQRSILDVLQEEASIRKYFLIKTSFGGIEYQSVPKAIATAFQKISEGAKYFIRSDIKDFFRHIPKDVVLSVISKEIVDPLFNDLLLKATEVELSNLGELGDYKKLFPLHEVGVAQGCCLSPLIGNILLNEFDKEMNGRNVTCLRYIDDFLILGSSRASVFSAFSSAQRILSEYRLTAYDPLVETGKAEHGYTKRGFAFLGCQIVNGLVRPDHNTCTRLLEKVKGEINESIKSMKNPKKCKLDDKKSFVDTLGNINNILKGWGNQYSFCNDHQVLDNMDKAIDVLLERYIQRYNTLTKIRYKTDPMNRRRLLGVHLVRDSKPNPVLISRTR